MKDDQQFLYTIRPVRIEMLTEGPTARETEVISLHFDHLSELAAQGIVEFAGRTDTDDERTFGIVVFYARSEKDALTSVVASSFFEDVDGASALVPLARSSMLA